MRPSVPRLLPLLALPLVASAVAAAPAAAAPKLVAAKCPTYIPGKNGNAGLHYVGVRGVGFTPNTEVDFLYSGDGTDGGGLLNSSTTGTLAGFTLGPSPIDFLKGHVRAYKLTAKDSMTGATASARLHVVKFGATVTRARHPQSVVTYRFYGFPRKRKIYAHFALGGKIRSTIYYGRAHGACGLLKKRARALGAPVRDGQWHVYFSNHRKFTATSARKRRFLDAFKFTVYAL